MKPDEDFLQRRAGRNIAMGLALGFLALLFFAITIARTVPS